MIESIATPVDFWRLAASRRRFEGVLALRQLRRLQSVLVDAEGECGFSLQFDCESALQLATVDVTVSAQLPLRCQRSLARFLFPVSVRQTLGLIRNDSEEARLAAGHEPLLVPPDGCLSLANVIEDELLLAVPIVPIAPGSALCQPNVDEDVPHTRPFAVLANLKT